MADLARWFEENAQNLAGYLGVPVMPEGLTPQEALEWGLTTMGVGDDRDE